MQASVARIDGTAGPRLIDQPIDTALMTILIAGNLVHAARSFTILFGPAYQLSYACQTLVTVWYFAVAVRRGHLKLAGAGAAVIAFLVLSHVMFAHSANVPVHFNALLMFVPLVSFVPLVESNCSVRRLITIFTIVSIGYLLFYVGLNRTLAVAGGETGAVMNNHNAQGQRVYLSAAHAVFVAFIALLAVELPIVARIGMFLLCLAALWLSGARTLQLIFLLVFGLAAAGLMTRWVRIGLFAIFVAAASALLYGLVDAAWNPFTHMSWDDSAFTRAHEYAVAMRTIEARFLFGTGIAGAPEQLQEYLGTARFEPLFASDLGLLGPLIELGVFAMLAFVAAVYYSVVPEPPSQRPDVWAVKLTCMTSGLLGVISPVLLYDASCSFFFLLVAIAIRQARVKAGIAEHLAQDPARPAPYGSPAC